MIEKYEGLEIWEHAFEHNKFYVPITCQCCKHIQYLSHDAKLIEGTPHFRFFSTIEEVKQAIELYNKLNR